jgi:hypothetical protein
VGAAVSGFTISIVVSAPGFAAGFVVNAIVVIFT